jgi:hypothetical protein
MLRLGFALLAAALVAVLGACGQTFSEVRVDDSKNGQSVKVHSGDVVKVTLNTTFWTFDQSSNPSILKQVGDQVVSPDPIGSCLPGMGCGVTTAWYKALSAGIAIVTASRYSCGEARRCVGDEGHYQVTVVVIA